MVLENTAVTNTSDKISTVDLTGPVCVSYISERHTVSTECANPEETISIFELPFFSFSVSITPPDSPPEQWRPPASLVSSFLLERKVHEELRGVWWTDVPHFPSNTIALDFELTSTTPVLEKGGNGDFFLEVENKCRYMYFISVVWCVKNLL